MKVVLVMFLVSLAGCASAGRYVSDQKEIWVNLNDKELFYCKAYSAEKEAKPECYEAKMLSR